MAGEIIVEFRLDFTPLVRAFEQIGEAMNTLVYGRKVLVVDDPAEAWPQTPGSFVAQLRDIVRHEFWCAAGQPERSPGARWIRNGGLLR